MKNDTYDKAFDYICSVYNHEVLYNEFLSKNKKKLYDLFIENIDTFDGEYLNGPLRYVSEKDTLVKVGMFFDSLGDEYCAAFIKDYENGKIKFGKDLSSEYVCKEKDFNITIKKTNTIYDSFHLVHEYVHRLSDNTDSSRFNKSFRVYGEMAAIYGELVFADFLKSIGNDTYEINMAKNSRAYIAYDDLYRFSFEYPLLRSTLNRKVINKDFYENNKKYYDKLNISKKEFDTGLKEIVKNDSSESGINRYNYGYGSLYAASLYSLNNYSNNINNLKTLIYMIKNCNDVSYISNCLPKEDYSNVKETYSINKK